MKHNKKKLLIIGEELIQYFYSLGCDNININLNSEQEECIIKINGNYKAEHRSRVEKLQHNLTQERNIELEECYWSIAGSGEINQGSELYVIGTMLDKCIVNYDDTTVEVIAYRKD